MNTNGKMAAHGRGFFGGGAVTESSIDWLLPGHTAVVRAGTAATLTMGERAIGTLHSSLRVLVRTWHAIAASGLVVTLRAFEDRERRHWLETYVGSTGRRRSTNGGQSDSCPD